MKFKNHRYWLLFWIGLTLLAHLISLTGGIIYLLIIFILAPLAQTIAIWALEQSNKSFFWMTRPILWILFMITPNDTQSAFILGLMLDALLSEFLLYKIFGSLNIGFYGVIHIAIVSLLYYLNEYLSDLCLGATLFEKILTLTCMYTFYTFVCGLTIAQLYGNEILKTKMKLNH